MSKSLLSPILLTLSIQPALAQALTSWQLEGCSKQTLSYSISRFKSDSLKSITLKFQYVDLPNTFPRKTTSSASTFLLYFDNAADQFVSLIIAGGQLLLEVQADKKRIQMIKGGFVLDKAVHVAVITFDDKSVSLTTDDVDSKSIDTDTPIDIQSSVYLGGFPGSKKLSDTVYPKVYKRDPFSGIVREFQMNSISMFPDMMTPSNCVKKLNIKDACRYNPCQNRGVCQQGAPPKCTCPVGYSGDYCQKGRPARLARQISKFDGDAVQSFTGIDWMEYSLERDSPITSFRDSLLVSFKTQRQTGLILHAGTGTDYMNLALIDGDLRFNIFVYQNLLSVSLSSETGIKSFADGNWHTLRVNRKLNQISQTIIMKVMIQVDNINQTMDAKIIDGANLKIANKIYVAGAPDNVIRKLPGNSVTDRFVGCLKNIQYSTKEGSLPLTLSKWADEILNDERKQYNFAMKGKPAIGCRLTTAKVLSFVTPESFVKLQTQVLVQNPGSFSISFFFRTLESEGLLLITSGAFTQKGSFASVELYNGRISAVFRDSKMQLQLSQSRTDRLNDGDWHLLKILADNSGAKVTIDGETSTMNIGGLGSIGEVYLGGFDNAVVRSSFIFPYQLRLAFAQIGFMGCVKDVTLGEKAIEVTRYAQRAFGTEEGCCEAKPPQTCRSTDCANDPCLNRAKCMPSPYSGFTCSCSGQAADWNGRRCELKANYEIFGRNNEVKALFPGEGIVSLIDTISLRFSSNSGNGVLISASGDNGQYGYRLEIINGRLRFEIRMDGAAKTIECGRDLADGQWRTIEIRRNKRIATLELRTSTDQKVPNCDSKVEVPTRVEKMKLQSFIVGAGKSKPQFNGTIQKLKFNGNALMDLCRDAEDQQKSPNGFTCSMPNRPKINTKMPNPANPFTFLTRESWQRTDSKIRADILWKNSRKYQVQIELRTTEEDGLIFWAGPADLVNQDEKRLILDQINKKAKEPRVSWAVLEIVNGRVHWIWKLKNKPAQVMTSNKVISDNEWHSILIDVKEEDRASAWDINIDKGRSQAEQLPLRNIGQNGKWEGFLDNSAVIIGGLPKYLWGTTASPVTSSEGFLGCVGKVQLNGNTMFLQRQARQIEKGCSGPLVACSAFYCKNGGLCRQGWDGPKCDCSGTSFIGDTCTKQYSKLRAETLSIDDSLTCVANFSSDSAGVVSFRLEDSGNVPSPYKNEQRDGTTAEDQFIVHAITSQPTGTILRVLSSMLTKSPDTMALLLEDGRPKFVYDIGGGETVMRYPKRIDDGQYHQIRIKRVSANATMIVDDLPAVTTSGNNKYSVFNSQSEIQIGGKLEANNIITEPFKGKILGVNFNQFKVLEAVQKGESKAARIIGDVTVTAIERNFDPKIPTTTTKPPTTTALFLDMTSDSYSGTMNDSSGFLNATLEDVPESSSLTTTFFTVAFAAGVMLVLLIAGLVFYRFRKHSKDDIPAVVPGMKPKTQKGNQPPGKNSEFYV